MNAHDSTPPRTGARRLIPPWEYRNLRAWARLRIGTGLAKTLAGFLLLSLHLYGWAALFLVAGIVGYTLGYWERGIARSASPRT